MRKQYYDFKLEGVEPKTTMISELKPNDSDSMSIHTPSIDSVEETCFGCEKTIKSQTVL